MTGTTQKQEVSNHLQTRTATEGLTTPAIDRPTEWREQSKTAGLSPDTDAKIDKIRSGDRMSYLGFGSRGDEVKWLKAQLNEWAKMTGRSGDLDDSDLMDAKTEALLKEFQGMYGLTADANGFEKTDKGLQQDGIFGIRTARVLDLVMGRKDKLISTDAFIAATNGMFRYNDYSSELDYSSKGDSQPTADDRQPVTSNIQGLRKKVMGDAELQKVEQIAARLKTDPKWLLAAMSFETGGSFSPSEVNGASGATGLIQFMPSTARSLGTSTGALAGMSRLQQLDYVEKYLFPYSGRLNSLEDVYMSILWPAAVGKSNNTVLMSGNVAYRQNDGLDINSDGAITKAEAAGKVREHYRQLFG